MTPVSENEEDLIRYLCGELTPAKQAAVERQLLVRPDWQAIAEQFSKARLAFAEDLDQPYVDPELAANHVIAAIRFREQGDGAQGAGAQGVGISVSQPAASTLTTTPARIPTLFRPRFFFSPLAVVASFAMVVFAWSSGVFHSSRKSSTPFSRVSTYTTGNGQRASITLPDGSQVELNVGSRLEVPVNYDRGNRTLRLLGEAFFTVRHDANLPFVVVSEGSTTRVLGTRFIVRQYPGDTSAVVAVQDGKVVVQSTVASAMQQVIVNSRGVTTLSVADPAQFTFKLGVLSIDGETLATAIPQLNRWYDADIRLGSSELAEWQLVGGFKQGSLSDLAALLEMTLGVRIVREGRVLTLYPRN